MVRWAALKDRYKSILQDADGAAEGELAKRVSSTREEERKLEMKRVTLPHYKWLLRSVQRDMRDRR